MKSLRMTLVTDGPTDAVLLHPLRWLLVENGVTAPLEPVWADLRALPKPPAGLVERIVAAVDFYPCDLLFVHRDAERESRQVRVDEIGRAFQKCRSDLFASRPCVCVVPVRMTEAWFLFDAGAIRHAAGNPASRTPLDLPEVGGLEDIPDPKQNLLQVLRDATELPLRRRQKFSLVQAIYRLAELIDDFSPLRRLPAFAALEAEVRSAIRAHGWGEDGSLAS